MNFFMQNNNDIGKINKILTKSKLKAKMSMQKERIIDIYEEIGKKVYENHIREEKINIEEELKKDCSKIDEISKQIEEERKAILELNNKKQCPNCFSELKACFNYCSNCGYKQNNNDDAEKILHDLENSQIKDKNKKEYNKVKKNLEES